MSTTSVELHSDVEHTLNLIAQQLQRSKDWVINQAITEFAKNQQIEDERWQDTLVALKEVEEGKVIDAEKVHEWLKSWGTANELEAPRF